MNCAVALFPVRKKTVFSVKGLNIHLCMISVCLISYYGNCHSNKEIKTPTLVYTYCFKFDCEQVIPNYINLFRPLIPDGIHLIFYRGLKGEREKPDLSLYAQC